MDSAQRNPREMTDEEVGNWMQELINKSVEEKGSAGGACSLEALKNPIRRNILEILEERALSIDEISERLRITGSVLRYHLNFLDSSYFIQISGNKVDLTPGGVSVVRSHKRS
jgi:predicted component of type VI protein secretion system